MFSLKKLDKTDGGVKRLSRGRMSILPQAPSVQKPEKDSGLGSSGDTDDESDPEADRLEGELDSMYAKYQERKSEADAKYRAKKAREEHNDEEWEGVSAGEESKSSDSSDLEEEEDDSDEDEDGAHSGTMIKDLKDTQATEGGLSRKAAAFFSQDIFKDLNLPTSADSVAPADGTAAQAAKKTKSQKKSENGDHKSDIAKDNGRGSFEVVKHADAEDDWDYEDKQKDGRPGTLKNKQVSITVLISL